MYNLDVFPTMLCLEFLGAGMILNEIQMWAKCLFLKEEKVLKSHVPIEGMVGRVTIIVILV